MGDKDLKDKMNDDDDEELKKKIIASPPKKTKPQTPISKALDTANQILVDGKSKNTKNDNTDNIQMNVEMNGATKTKQDEEQKSDSPEMNENEQNEKEKEKEKEREKEKKTEKKEEPYLVKIMRQRKERYIAAYRVRLTRIYKQHQPAKLSKIDGWIKGGDAEEIHKLYSRICAKYGLSPCPLYEGSEHEPAPTLDEKEKPAQKISETQNNDTADSNTNHNHNHNDTQKEKEKNGISSFKFKTDDDENENTATSTSNQHIFSTQN